MERIEVLKTYKMYIGGKFPRTESGRYYTPEINGKSIGNICLGSRKDVRNAVVAARAAQSGWWGRTAYNRSQILYRIAEMLETRRAQFMEELQTQGASKAQAKKEVDASIDRLIHYSGWCDKYQQIFSSVNPVASSHFNFSALEPMGLVFICAPENSPLLGLVSVIAPAIVAGNAVVVLASEQKPLSAVTFAEVLNSSDVPGGVVNIITGKRDELLGHAAKHMDVNALVLTDVDADTMKAVQIDAAENMKRLRAYGKELLSAKGQSPYMIKDLSEIKTTWHPIEHISASGSGY